MLDKTLTYFFSERGIDIKQQEKVLCKEDRGQGGFETRRMGDGRVGDGAMGDGAMGNGVWGNGEWNKWEVYPMQGTVYTSFTLILLFFSKIIKGIYLK